MKPTLEQLEEFTDLEINIAVTEKLKITNEVRNGKVFQAVKHDGDNVISIIANVDYCNNWADMGALANKHKISARCDGLGRVWAATSLLGEFTAYDKSELRAKAIVFLMMEI